MNGVEFLSSETICNTIPPYRAELRKEKDQLTQELIEHGYRRKN